MNEVRYAVIIGINDYDINPLEFCVNDALSVKNIIKNKANFLEENIFLITSEINDAVKDITGKLFEVVLKIKQVFNKEEDSIFFYFAGHGSQEDGQSSLAFHETTYPIAEVYKLFKDLSPKMQFYVIDACESGNKTLTRSVFREKKNIIRELIENSSGILFLYACQANQSAQEVKSKQHGLMTNYFLDAINNSKLYDEDGILTPYRIQEYVAKMVVKHSDFNQTPVVENNISGYYPFAMQAPNFDTKIQESEKISGSERKQEITQISFNRTSRIELQRVAFEYIKYTFADFIKEYFNDYEIKYFDKIEDMKLINNKVLLEKIIDDACGKYSCINYTIRMEETPIYENSLLNMTNMASILGLPSERKINGYNKRPKLNYDSEYFDVINILLINSDIWKVSLGLGAVMYQAKWGGVISPYFYRIEWDGETNSIIEDINKYYYTYLIEQSSLDQIPNLKLEIFEDIIKYNNMWNKKRSDELDGFKIKPKENSSLIVKM